MAQVWENTSFLLELNKKSVLPLVLHIYGLSTCTETVYEQETQEINENIH